MVRWSLLFGCVACVGILTAVALLPAASQEGKPLGRVGQKIPDFQVPDLSGKSWSLQSQAGKKAIVVVFVSCECPMSNAYLDRLAELARTYEPRGVAFAMVNANPHEDVQQMAQHAREYQIATPLLKDGKQAAVGALGAKINPEAFVLDGTFTLRYRGRIDDGYSARLRKNARTMRFDLKEALDEILAGKPVSVPVTEAFGCPILPAKEARPATAAAVTFNRDVMPILQNRCQECHRQGEVGPFPLMTYEQTIRWGEDIKIYTENGKMPPWKPIEGHDAFNNVRTLTKKEIATLAQWVDQGMVEGDPRDLPAPKEFSDGWRLGEPDLILEPAEEMTVGASGKDLFRVFVLPTNLTEDRYVSAIEVRPTNKRVVHHTLNFLDTMGRGRKMEEAERQREKKADEVDHGPGYSVNMGVGFFPPSGSLGGWAPGNLMRPLPEGVGYYLPKGSDVVLQVHYHRTGKVEKDRIRLGLHFAKKPVTHRLQPMVIPGFFAAIPPGVENFVVQGAMQINQDVTLYQITPHMHLFGRKITASMVLPDRTRKQLIGINDWDYNWQETYYFKEPIKVPAGTRFEVEAVYDNSENNPLNPNRPPKPVRLGEQTTDEMCFVFLGATADKPGRISVSPARFGGTKKDTGE